MLRPTPPRPTKAKAKVKKGLPKRLNRPGYLASKARYRSERRREKNRANRIVKAALRSKDPRKVAMAQASKSKRINNIDWTLSYVKKALNRRGL
jgi:hypothetical protein